MEMTLVIVTILSLALALGMGAVLWRQLQDERRRADARVAALVDGFAQHTPPATDVDAHAATDAHERPAYQGDTLPAFARSQDAAVAADASAVNGAAASGDARLRTIALDSSNEMPSKGEASTKDWLLEFPSSYRTDGTRIDPARAEEPWDDAVIGNPEEVSIAHAAWPEGRRTTPRQTPPIRDWREVRVDPPAVDRGTRVGGSNGRDDADQATASESARELFGQVSQADQAVTTNRFTQVAVAVALLFGLGLSIWTVSRLAVYAASPSTPAATAASANAGAGTAAAAVPPLELLALRQSRSGNTLTIDGLVRNPRGGARQERLTAVVFFFNARGEFLTSARTPLDFRTLAPGDESPFQLTLGAPAGASRYRVSFRQDEGVIVAHVDRRQASDAAALSRAGS